MLAGAASASSGRAASTKRLTRAAVRAASGAAAVTGRGGTPVAWGSVSVTRPDSPEPRSTSTKRCSFTGSMRSSAPSTRISRRRSQSRTQTSVGMRPARRSVMRPFVSTVQKFPRAATSPSRSSKSIPRASSTPRPTG